MRAALALLCLVLVSTVHAGRIETLKGKLEQDGGKYVLNLTDAYTLEFGGQSISSKRLQVEGWTSTDIPKLDAAKRKQIELTGYIYPGATEDSEKLVIFVKAVPGNSPAIQTVAVMPNSPEQKAPETLLVPVVNIGKIEQNNVAIENTAIAISTQTNVLIDNRTISKADGLSAPALVGTWKGKYVVENCNESIQLCGVPTA